MNRKEMFRTILPYLTDVPFDLFEDYAGTEKYEELWNEFIDWKEEILKETLEAGDDKNG